MAGLSDQLVHFVHHQDHRSPQAPEAAWRLRLAIFVRGPKRKMGNGYGSKLNHQSNKKNAVVLGSIYASTTHFEVIQFNKPNHGRNGLRKASALPAEPLSAALTKLGIGLLEVTAGLVEAPEAESAASMSRSSSPARGWTKNEWG